MFWGKSTDKTAPPFLMAKSCCFRKQNALPDFGPIYVIAQLGPVNELKLETSGISNHG